MLFRVELVLAWLLLSYSVHAFVISTFDRRTAKHCRTYPLFDVVSSDVQSISDNVSKVSESDESLSTAPPLQSNDKNYFMEVIPPTNPNKEFLLALGAITGRGEYATKQQKESAEKVVATMESTCTTIDTNELYGTWDLVFSTTELFRSSPFFMAGRAVCKTDQEVQQYNWFCTMHRKALAISNIVNVRQIINEQKLVSEFEVKVGSIPFLSDFTPLKYSGGIPLTIDGSIVSTADIESIDTMSDDKTLALQLFMDTVEIKGSNIPGLRQLQDNGIGNKLQSRSLSDFIVSNLPDLYTIPPKPSFRITYLDSSLRISRDQDDNIFVYIKTSTNTQPTSYDTIDSDLGIGRLLGGFNEAVTRIYL
jgi:PAP_fibrillin